MRGRELSRRLQGPPLNCSIEPSSGGSHRWVVSESGYRVRLAFHDQQEITGGLVRQILMKSFHLTEAEALEVAGG